jgi:hypothetical protein
MVIHPAKLPNSQRVVLGRNEMIVLSIESPLSLASVHHLNRRNKQGKVHSGPNVSGYRSTMSRANPSHFLAPTVWIAVALTRGSVAIASNNARTP